MSPNKTVKDVMVGIFEYPHIPYWFSVNQAIRIVKVSFLRSKKYLEPMAILVFDEKYNLIGTVTFKDILKGLEPRIKEQTGQVLDEGHSEPPNDWHSFFGEASIALAEKPVSDILVPATFFVEPGDPVTKAAYLMIRHDLVLLPVLEEKKKFIGIVRMIEIFDEISAVLLNEEKE
jgi:CBS domain-containing protein